MSDIYWVFLKQQQQHRYMMISIQPDLLSSHSSCSQDWAQAWTLNQTRLIWDLRICWIRLRWPWIPMGQVRATWGCQKAEWSGNKKEEGATLLSWFHHATNHCWLPKRGGSRHWGALRGAAPCRHSSRSGAGGGEEGNLWLLIGKPKEC